MYKAENTIINFTDYEKTYGDETFTLTPAGYENPEFTYASSNTDVAAVDGDTGEVTIVGAGIAEITVTAAATHNYAAASAVCKVTVNKAEQTLSGLQNLVKVNGDEPFTVTPGTNASAENPSFTYLSDDTSVIDLDQDGKFLIVGAGTANITVLAGGTANYLSTTDTFEIRVLVNTTGLKAAIAEAENLLNGLDSGYIGDGDGQYPQEEVDVLDDAVKEAKAVAENTEVSQEAVDIAEEKLLSAIEVFRNSLIRVDFDQLDSAISQAERLSAYDYTTASWEILEDALAAGKTDRATEGITQARVDEATKKIYAAITALESVYQFKTGFAAFTGSSSVTAAIDAPYEKFVSLTVGGVLLDQDSYTIDQSSMVITLPETYLKTLANGTYTVTARFTDGAAATMLTVNVSETKAVTGVTLDQSSARVMAGRTLKLTAAVNPSDAANKNLIWSSSDLSIATVDANGNVTGIKDGNVFIMVTTIDGCYTATCSVTVVEASTSDTNTSSGTQDSVKTGDSENIWLWISLLGTSVLVVLGIYLISRRKLSVWKRK